MNHRPSVISLFFVLFLFALFLPEGDAAWYESEIEYREAVTKIVERKDIVWETQPENYFRFGSVIVSADGSRVFFSGRCEYCNKAEVRPFIVGPDGSGVTYLSEMLPNEITSRWSGWRNVLLSDDGSKIFFRAVIEAGYYGSEYLYAYDIGSSTRSLAVNRDGGFAPFSSAWHFNIDKTGSTVYLDKLDTGWDESLQKHKKGLFYTPTGGTIQWYFDVDDLPCQSNCGNLNLFLKHGVSAIGGRAFFQWNSDYEKTDGSDQHTALYYTDLSGVPVKITDDQAYIYDGDTRGMCDAEGKTAIYRFTQDSSSSPRKLAVVDVETKASKDVAWTTDLNGFSAHMSRSGKYALVNGAYGNSGGAYYQTMIDLDSGKSRDTWSYHMMSRWGTTSNITGDDRYYFYDINDTASNSGLYRIDTKTTGDPRAPYVNSIEFSSPAILDQDGFLVSVRASVSDPQRDIDRVILLPLVEGQETTSWAMGRAPLAFPSGDFGFTYLYDDGTHGDAVAGDGIYSFDSIATRKGDRDDDGWNTWYRHYTLPSDLGIRVVVRDKENNYAIADTVIRVTDNPADIPGTGSTDNAQIKADFGIIIPCANYSDGALNMNLKLEFKFENIDSDGDYLWSLVNLSEIQNAGGTGCISISPNLTIDLPRTVYESPSGSLSFQLGLLFKKVDSATNKLIWKLGTIKAN